MKIAEVALAPRGAARTNQDNPALGLELTVRDNCKGAHFRHGCHQKPSYESAPPARIAAIFQADLARCIDTLTQAGPLACGKSP
jgi:hypothetical protein